MISIFSEAGYLIPDTPHPKLCFFFKKAVYQGQVGRAFLSKTKPQIAVLSLLMLSLGALCHQKAGVFQPQGIPTTICNIGFPQCLPDDTRRRYFLRREVRSKLCGSFPRLNTYGTFYGECSSLTFLQPLCCQRISYSSSLHEDYDEPEILLDQIVKSVPKALTLDIICCCLPPLL